MKENLEGDKLGCKTKAGTPSICVTQKCPVKLKSRRETKGEVPTDSGVKKGPAKWGRALPLNTVNRPEGRIRPVWGSNLINLKDKPEAAGAVSYKAKKSFPIGRQAEAFNVTANLDTAEQFVQEYKKGKIQKKPEMEPKKSVVQFKIDELPQKNLTGDQTEALGESSDETGNQEVDENTSERVKEASDDAHLVEYLKELSTAKQKTNKGRAEAKMASPALAGIPMTTPRSSPSPRRRGHTENYRQGATAEGAPLPGVISEDSDDDLGDSSGEDEYEEWINRLRRLEWECERQLQDLHAQKVQERSSRNQK